MAAPLPSTAIHNHSAGTARAGRQKAVALGPTSLNRTRIGEKAMATAPLNKALTAARVVLSFVEKRELAPLIATTLGPVLRKDSIGSTGIAVRDFTEHNPTNA